MNKYKRYIFMHHMMMFKRIKRMYYFVLGKKKISQKINAVCL